LGKIPSSGALDSGRQKKGAPSLRNHAGKPARPVAVGRSLSRILNNRLSSMYSKPDTSTVCFKGGAK